MSTTKTGKLAVAYCRVSTDLEEQKKSIQEQQKQWLEFFDENNIKSAEIGCICHREVVGLKANGEPKKGKLIVEPLSNSLYVDEGITGTSLKNRKAFLQMVEDAKMKKFDTIYVEDVSRFTRSMEDGLQIIKDLREIGVAVFFKKENLNSLDTSKEFELQLRISLAQEESRMKSSRMKWAMQRLHEKYGWNSTAPFGYDIVDGFLKINEEQSKVVQMIYDKYAKEHWGVYKICRHLNNYENADGTIGIPTQKGVQWSFTQVRRILDNQIYRGEYRTHTVETDDITRHTTKIVPESEQIVKQIEELRIIDEHTYNLTKNEMTNRRENYYQRGNGVSSKHLFSTILYCGYCGSVFKRKKRHGYIRKDGTCKEIGYEWTCALTDMYGATTKSKGGRCSGGRNQLIEDDLLEAVKYEITELQENNFDSSFTMYMKMKFGESDSIDKSELESKLDGLMLEMRELRREKINGLISGDVYDDALLELNKDIENVKAEIDRIDHLTEIKKNQWNQYEAYKKELKEIDINNLTNADLKNLFSRIIVRYKVDENGKKIPYLRFVYRFLDTTSDILLDKMGGDANIKAFTPMYKYKTAQMIDDIE